MAKVILNMQLWHSIMLLLLVIFAPLITYATPDDHAHNHEDHHEHHEHHHDNHDETEQSLGGKLTLPNIKDCTNSE